MQACTERILTFGILLKGEMKLNVNVLTSSVTYIRKQKKLILDKNGAAGVTLN